MQAIELNTQIQADGVISLPETYKHWYGKNAKLILLETTEPVATENTPYTIFSQLDLGEGDVSLIPSAQTKVTALRQWLDTIPEVPSIPLSDLDRGELYR